MSQNLGSLPTPCHTMSHLVDPLPPLTCDVIYGWPLFFNFANFNPVPLFLWSSIFSCVTNPGLFMFKDILRYLNNNKKDTGSALVVEQIQIFLLDSHDLWCYSEDNVFKHIKKIWVTPLWIEVVGSWTCAVCCIWYFNFACASLFVTPAVLVQ